MAVTSRTSRILLLVVAAAAAGGIIFGVLAWRAVTVEQAETHEASQRFRAVRAAFGSATPLLDVDDAGNVTRRAPLPSRAPLLIARLSALAYQPGSQRLVRGDVPFWFFKLKAPAAQLALHDTGLDLNRLQVTAADLERYGPAVLIDHTSKDGNRLLVWTE